MKKKVIAYLHTHWDREWYREFEVFRLRLIRVFDNVLELLEQSKIPAFYFDGQVCALMDYLEFRPEKEPLIRKLIKEKKLYIGPFYTLVDEFLTDKKCFEKNLEIGLSISRNFGCEDFIGYLADTFGHSQNVPKILKKYGVDKCVVWRGCGELPSEFIFNGINTVNLVRGYFMDIFSAGISIEEKASWLKDNLDKIADKSGKYLLLPIGADHLGVESDIQEQIERVNKLLDDYEIILSTPFEYFNLVKDNFKKEYNDELRDNSKTFILSGSYSARTKIKQYNTVASYKLNFAENVQSRFGDKYCRAIEYAYKLLLKNLAHDGICGCSTDDVHKENIIRYKKVIQIADTILKEIKFMYPVEFKNILKEYAKNNCCLLETENISVPESGQIISQRKGFVDEILYDTQKIPVTEDYTTIYKYLEVVSEKNNDEIFNINLLTDKIKLENNKIIFSNIFIDFVKYNDYGDAYNFGAEENDTPEVAEIIDSEIIMKGHLRVGLKVKTSFFDVCIFLNKGSKLLKFKVNWINTEKNKLWQVRFTLPEPISTTYSEDMDSVITRNFDPNYNMRDYLPKTRGIEVKTNIAPMQRYVGVGNFGIVTKGLNEYEIYKNTLSVTLLRSIGIISNPLNPSRSTPAGPPIETPEAQQIGENVAEFAVGFFNNQDYKKCVNELFFNELV